MQPDLLFVCLAPLRRQAVDDYSLGELVLDDASDLTRTYGAATLADSETQTFAASNRSDQLDVDLDVVTRHYHLDTSGEHDLTGYIQGADVELGTIVVVERSVTTTLFLLQDVDRSLEVIVGLDNTRVADYHTTLDGLIVNTAEQQTNVVTSFTLIEDLAEHLNAGNYRLHLGTQTHDLNLIAHLNDTSLDTTGSNGATASD